MARNGSLTRRQIVAAADELFYSRGLHSVSVDAIAEKAGITKKTFYYHFPSKDQLIASYLEARDRPTAERFKEWAGTDGSVADRLGRLFSHLGRSSRSPSWFGCGFMRVAAELASLPGHPAMEVARSHKARCEQWFLQMLIDEGHPDAKALSRALVMLIDGAVWQTLLHRDAVYAASAGQVVQMLLTKP